MTAGNLLRVPVHAFLFGVLCGSADLAAALLLHEYPPEDFRAGFLGFAVTAGMATGGALLGVAGLDAVARRCGHARSAFVLPAECAAAIFLFLFVFAGLGDVSFTAAKPWLAALLLLAVASAAAGGSTRAMRRLMAPAEAELDSQLLAAATLISLGGLTALWLMLTYPVGFRSALVLAVLAVAVFGSVLLGWRRPLLAVPTWLIVVAAWAIAAESFYPRPDAVKRGGRSNHPPVILLMIDTLRADALSFDAADTTPALARLAGTSTVFEEAYSPSPWTVPAMMSIMTGTSPFIHQASHRRARIPDVLTTLSERLREAGYVTGAVGNQPWLVDRSRGFARGFDFFDFYPKPNVGGMIGTRIGRRLYPGLLGGEGRAEDLVRIAMSWISANRTNPFFLWVHLFEPHVPYEPTDASRSGRDRNGRLSEEQKREIQNGRLTPPDDRARIKQLYDLEVARVDGVLGGFLDALREMGLFDEAVLVVTSDHGEEFWEHGGFEHGHTLHRELLHVPLLLKLPRQAVAQKVTSSVTTEEVTPTLLSITGVDRAAGERSWERYLGEAAGSGTQQLYFTGLLYSDEQDAVTFDGLKYIRSRLNGWERLYDLQADPMEKADLSLTHPLEVERARAMLQRQLSSSEVARKAAGLHAPEGVVPLSEELRSLGYIQ